LAHPNPQNILHWYFVFYDLNDSPYEGGIYMGKLEFTTDYPHRPPKIMMITPSGRFHLNSAICTTFSSYHPEKWQPSWGVPTIILGLLSFWHEDGGGIGKIYSTDKEKKYFAKKSMEFNRKNHMFMKLFNDDQAFKNALAGKGVTKPKKASDDKLGRKSSKLNGV